jgi:hypothetical protein
MLIQRDASAYGRACTEFTNVATATEQEGHKPVEAAAVDSDRDIFDAP